MIRCYRGMQVFLFLLVLVMVAGCSRTPTAQTQPVPATTTPPIETTAPAPTSLPVPPTTSTTLPTPAPALPPPTPAPPASESLILQVGGSGQYQSIQKAIDSAKPGATIQVAQGKYSENLRISATKDLRLQGGWSPDFASRSENSTLTVIDGRGRDSVLSVNITGSTTVKISVDDITIQNGKAQDGGGIFARADRGSEIGLTLTNVQVLRNQADYGGGIRINSLGKSSVTAKIERSDISENVAKYIGGGLHGSTHSGGMASVNISANRISGNIVTGLSTVEGGLGIGWGGGIDGGGAAFCAQKEGKTIALLQNNLITGNRSGWGGGVFGYSFGTGSVVEVTLKNNLITRNQTTGGGAGIFSCAGSTSPDGFAGGSIVWNLTNNTITQNIAGQGAGGITMASGSIYGDGGDIILNMRNDIVWGNTDPSGNVRLTPQIAVGVQPGKAGTAKATISYSNFKDIITSGNGTYTSDHIIDKDPLFVDPAKGDYRLDDKSPCIDSGDPDTIFNDRLRPPAKGTERNDIGVYGGPKNYDWPEQTNVRTYG